MQERQKKNDKILLNKRENGYNYLELVSWGDVVTFVSRNNMNNDRVKSVILAY